MRVTLRCESSSRKTARWQASTCASAADGACTASTSGHQRTCKVGMQRGQKPSRGGRGELYRLESMPFSHRLVHDSQPPHLSCGAVVFPCTFVVWCEQVDQKLEINCAYKRARPVCASSAGLVCTVEDGCVREQQDAVLSLSWSPTIRGRALRSRPNSEEMYVHLACR